MRKSPHDVNPDLALLKPYPFERLAALLDGVTPPKDQQLLKLSVGEPQHAPPEVVVQTLTDNLTLLAKLSLIHISEPTRPY